MSLPSLNAVQNPAVTPSQLVVLTASATATSASATATSTSSSASTSSGALSATATSAAGLSLGGFSSLKGGSSGGTGEALLVAVEGNTYLSVPVEVSTCTSPSVRTQALAAAHQQMLQQLPGHQH